MKKTISRILKITAVLLPVAAFLLLNPWVMSEETVRIRGFYQEEPDSLDMVLLGGSETFTAFSPTLAYEEFGFTSYPYAVAANYVELFPEQLAEIYLTQTPALVVVDINGALYTEGLPNEDEIFRTYIEGVPFGMNKLRAVRAHGDPEQRLSYHLPFLMYHGSKTPREMASITLNTLLTEGRGFLYLKGNTSSTALADLSSPRDVDGDDSTLPLPPATEEKLRNLLEHCRDKNYVNLLFVNFPHAIASEQTYDRYRLSNAAGELIRTYGYDYLNLEQHKSAMGLDFQRDFYNEDHLNIYGQQKCTRYFARLLTEDHALTPGPQAERNRLRWEECARFNHLYYTHYENVANADPGGDHWFWENRYLVDALNQLKNG